MHAVRSQRSGRRRPVAVAVAAGVAAVVVAGVVVSVAVLDVGRGGRAPSFDDVVAEVTAFVEGERGLSFKEPATVRVVGDDGLARLVAESSAERRDEMARENDLHHTLGIVPADIDFAAQLVALQSVSVGGQYDPETGVLSLRDTSTTPYARSTIAHELTHALDDQWFGLDRPELAEARDGSAFGFSALGEGNARRVEFAYLATLSDAEQREADAERARLGASSHEAGVGLHPHLGLHLGAAYEYGPPLVDAILSHGGQAALDEAFRSPPTTHEQVLFPQRYLDREEAVAVDPPAADGPVTDEGTIGVFKRGIMRGGGPGRGPAARWGGDRYVVWPADGGERSCLRARVVGDTPAATAAFAEALEEWAGRQPDATVAATGGDGPVEFTACSPRTGGSSAAAVGGGGDADIDCPGTPLAGFGEAQVTITGPDGEEVQRCLHLADTEPRTARGLMEVTDETLGGYDGMLFVFPAERQGAFWMRNTPMPLSIAYLDGQGRIVSTADMVPCGDHPDCPSYPPEGPYRFAVEGPYRFAVEGPYRFAVEVPQGRLDDIGLVEGATLHLDGVRSL